jgi:hypothetical protein
MHKLQICCTHVLAAIDSRDMGYGGFAASAKREFVAGDSKNVESMDSGQWRIDNGGMFQGSIFNSLLKRHGYPLAMRGWLKT